MVINGERIDLSTNCAVITGQLSKKEKLDTDITPLTTITSKQTIDLNIKHKTPF